MRVIAGTFRSRPLQAPRGLDTRPTSDRLRETLFNILAPRIEGARFADLYAGSGAVGIEAISRGAEFVYFAELAEPALSALRKNLSALNIPGGYAIESRSSARLLQSLTRKPQPLDIVFLDPPYDDQAAYEETLSLLAREHRSLLAPNALVVAEHRKQKSPAESYGALSLTRLVIQGDAALSFYAVAEGSENKENTE